MPREVAALTPTQLRATGEFIAGNQNPDGSIPWWRGGRVDPWNHVEAAMALDVVGNHAAAERAYGWLATAQRADGAWAASYEGGDAADATLDANFCAYIAAGTWHHWLATRDGQFLKQMWRVVDRAITFTLDLQRPDGTISWARDATYRAWPGALLTGSSCIHLSLECAIAIAFELDHDRPDWELSLEMLRLAITSDDEIFVPKDRFAMDWYYPVLGRALIGDAAIARLTKEWDRFVVDGRGSRCVDDRPWVTTAETCELVIALYSVRLVDDARRLFEWVQHLRVRDAYWTGATYPDGRAWPVEKTSWSAAAVLLAADVLEGRSPTSVFFAHPETRAPLNQSTSTPL